MNTLHKTKGKELEVYEELGKFADEGAFTIKTRSIYDI
jgi:hypothetical protein